MTDVYPHQKVNFVSSSIATEEHGGADIQAQIEHIARVSNIAGVSEKSPGQLTRYLMDNSHWSPLEMADVCLEIYTTRDIGRQILRHNSFRFQEFSQRYAEATDLPCAIRQARRQDNKNRQNSFDDLPLNIREDFLHDQDRIWEQAINAYTDAIAKGIAKECARVLLPEGLTMSRMYMKGNLRSWFFYLKVRMGNGTQAEHIDVANKCFNILNSLAPDIFSEANLRG